MRTVVSLSTSDIEIIVKDHLQKSFRTVSDARVEMREEVTGNKTEEKIVQVFKGLSFDVEL